MNFLKIKRPVSNVGVFIRVPFTVSPPPKLPEFLSAAIRWIFPIIQSRTGKNKMSTGLYSAFPAYLLTKRAKPHKIDPLTTLMGRKAKCPAFREPAAAASRWGTFADDCSRSLPPERT